MSLLLALLLTSSTQLEVSSALAPCHVDEALFSELAALEGSAAKLVLSASDGPGENLTIELFDDDGRHLLERRVSLPAMRCEAVVRAVRIVLDRFREPVHELGPTALRLQSAAADPSSALTRAKIYAHGEIAWGEAMTAVPAWGVAALVSAPWRQLELAADFGFTAFPARSVPSALDGASEELRAWSATARVGASHCWRGQRLEACLGARVGAARVAGTLAPQPEAVGRKVSGALWRPSGRLELRADFAVHPRLLLSACLFATALATAAPVLREGQEVTDLPRATIGLAFGGGVPFF